MKKNVLLLKKSSNFGDDHYLKRASTSNATFHGNYWYVSAHSSLENGLSQGGLWLY